MSATQGTGAYGTLLQRSTDGVAYTTVSEITNLSGPGRSAETLDFTHMESPEGYREIKPSFKSGGEVTLEVNYTPAVASQYVLSQDFESQLIRYWKVAWPDDANSYTKFQGYVTAIAPAAPVDGKLTENVTIMVSGPVNDYPPNEE